MRRSSHSCNCNVHFHIGALWPCEEYPYWTHITADVSGATWKVGDTYIHKDGRLTALDHPAVKAVADKYPDRPTLYGCPASF